MLSLEPTCDLLDSSFARAVLVATVAWSARDNVSLIVSVISREMMTLLPPAFGTASRSKGGLRDLACLTIPLVAQWSFRLN